jgi:tRNA pseudouridine55 synthase
LLVVCSKGTYIRSLARDLGEALGCGAHLTRLVRLWVGSFGLGDAVSLDEIAAAASAGRPETVLCSADAALAGLPAILVPEQRVIDLSNGRAWPAAGQHAPDGPTRVYDIGGRLLGLAEHDLRRRAWQPRLALMQAPAGAAGQPVPVPENGLGGDEQDG